MPLDRLDQIQNDLTTLRDYCAENFSRLDAKLGTVLGRVEELSRGQHRPTATPAVHIGDHLAELHATGPTNLKGDQRANVPPTDWRPFAVLALFLLALLTLFLGGAIETPFLSIDRHPAASPKPGPEQPPQPHPIN